MKTLVSVAGLALLGVSLSACTTVVTSDTSELESKIDALQARVAKLESSSTVEELAQIRTQLATQEDRIARLARQRAAQVPPTRRPPAAGKRASQDTPPPGAARRAMGAVDRTAQRAKQIAQRVGLTPEQTAELERVLSAQRTAIMDAVKASRADNLSKEEAAERRRAVKEQVEGMMNAFKATLTEEQRSKIEKMLPGRRKPIGGKRAFGERPKGTKRDKGAARPKRDKQGKQKKQKDQAPDADGGLRF